MMKALPASIIILVLLGGIAVLLSASPVSKQEVNTTPSAKAAIVLPQDGRILVSDRINTTVFPAVAEAQLSLAGRLGMITTEGIDVIEAEEVSWGNGCLDLSAPEELCTQVITPGYRVTLEARGKVYIYRTNATGSFIRFESEY